MYISYFDSNFISEYNFVVYMPGKIGAVAVGQDGEFPIQINVYNQFILLNDWGGPWWQSSKTLASHL